MSQPGITPEHGDYGWPYSTAQPGTPYAPIATQPAGWYQDPGQPGQRWWDGLQWTAYTQPAMPYAQPQIVVNTMVNVGSNAQKSVGVAFLLAFLFGPVGMFYSTVAGGLIMFVIAIIVGGLTFGVGLLLVWPACIIWACVAASGK